MRGRWDWPVCWPNGRATAGAGVVPEAAVPGGGKRSPTYNWKVSLYLGDQVLLLVLVPCFLLLSLRLGPRTHTSTKGRNMALVCQLRFLIATTGTTQHREGGRWWRRGCRRPLWPLPFEESSRLRCGKPPA